MSRVLGISGGVGGARLAFGLARVLGPEDLTLAVNTGDDLEHLGLTICPDIDTVVYTLAGLADRERGWGRAGETWGFMETLKQLGAEGWFNLGDHDLAMHVERTRRLADGETLSEVTRDLAGRLGVRHPVVPMSDEPVRTFVLTNEGAISFQEYLVRERGQPKVRGFAFRGADSARPSPGFKAALERADLEAVIICPSNPYVSVDPVLAVPGVRESLLRRTAPAVAVSPIVGGDVVKGPLAKMLRELGLSVDNLVIAEHYLGLIDGLVIDERDAKDAPAIEGLGLRVLVTDTLMRDDEDRTRLASETLSFAETTTPLARAGDTP